MAHTSNISRTLRHGLGAAALTMGAFGVGPVIGLTASQVPMIEVVEYAPEGAPTATYEAFLAIPFESSASASTDDQEMVEGREPSDPDGTGDTTDVEPVEPVRPDVADDAAAVKRPAPVEEAAKAPVEAPDEPAPEVPASDEDVKSILEHALAGTRPMKRKGRRCEVTRSNPKIERTSKGAFTVEKSLVMWYVTHIKALNDLGWSSKHEGDDGRSDGMRIGGVSCGNDLHLAGIRSGDVVHRVNGHEVRSIPQAIFVYRKVRKDPRIQVELTRRGKPMTLTYRLT